jgi:hypothetical protein
MGTTFFVTHSGTLEVSVNGALVASEGRRCWRYLWLKMGY